MSHRTSRLAKDDNTASLESGRDAAIAPPAPTPQDATAGDPHQLRRTILGSVAGNFIEQYDFGLYGSMAAIALGTLFFTNEDPTVALLASFSIYAVGFVARPVGGMIAGHFGDLYGRKQILILMLLLGGLSTALIGLLPTYAAMGIAAPILLIVLRCIQGLSVGGEMAGAVLIVNESAPTKWRGFYSAFVPASSSLGFVAANLAILVFASMDEGDFLSWGWRVPFLLSFTMVAVGVWIRSKVQETDAFRAQQVNDTQHAAENSGVASAPDNPTRSARRSPILVAFSENPGRLIAVTLICAGFGAANYTALTWVLGYLSLQGHAATVGLIGVIAAQGGYALSNIVSSAASDRFGRRRLMMLGGACYMVFSMPLLALIHNGENWMIWFAMTALLVFSGMIYGPLCALMCESFSTDHRFSGSSTAYAVGLAIGGGFAPLIATWLFRTSNSLIPVSLLMIVSALVVVVGTAAVKETARVELK